MNKILLTIPLFFLAYCVFAQNIHADMVAMYNSYNKLQYFSSEIQVKIYTDLNDTRPAMVKSGGIKKSNTMYAAYLEDVRMVINKDYLVYVSGYDKLIYYKAHAKKVPDKFKEPFSMKEIASMIDTALRKSDTVDFLGIKDGQKQYMIRTHSSIIQATALFIDVNTNLISKIVYYYNKDVMKKNNKVVVEFSNTVYTAPLPVSIFSELQYMKKVGNSFVAADNYKGFEVFNDSSFDEED